MGRPGLTWYGEDVGSAIQDVKKSIAKIETNKFDKEDLAVLLLANNELIKALISNDYKD